MKYVVDYRYGYAGQKIDVSNNNNTITYTYDLFGRLILTQNPDGGETRITYYDTAFPRYTLTEVKETATSYIPTYGYYDGFGRSIQVSTLGNTLVNNTPTPVSIITQTRYDYMGRIDLTSGPFFGSGTGYPQTPPVTGYPFTWTSCFDFRGRPVFIKSRHGDYPNEYITTSFAYQGFRTTVTDPDGSIKREVKDYLGRIIRVREWLLDNGATTITITNYAYNAAGDLIKVTDNQGNITTLAYDTQGHKRDMIDPDMGHWTYNYDKNGNLTDQIDAKGVLIHFDYDELNRVLNKKYFINGQLSPNDSPVTYTYDNSTTGANGIGRPYTSTKGNIVITNNKYDSMGRSLKVTKKIDGTDYITRNQYDLSGKVKKLTYPDNYYITYEYYPGTNLIKTITDSSQVIQTLYTDYEPTGKIGQINHANGTATLYTYDPWSTRLFGIVTQDPSGQPLNDLQNKSYHYTRAGDIDQIIDHKKNVTYNYTYDSLHRLKTENGGPEAISYTYDALGRILTRTIGNKAFTYSYNNSAHIHAVSNVTYNGNNYAFSYDANGNLTSSPDLSNIDQVVTRTVTYDADNMPVQIVRGSTTVGFTYDGTGTRTKKAVTGGSTALYIGEHYEVRDSVITKYIFGGNLRLAVIKGSLTYYYHKDHLGSTGAITDSSGAKVESAEYQPFGTMREYTGTDISAYKFTDQELDNETNLYNYDARLYDPILGMFVTPDSIVPNMFDPQSLNRYAYCRNNPLIYTDPSGNTQIEGADQFNRYDKGLYPNRAANNDAITDKIVDATQWVEVTRFGPTTPTTPAAPPTQEPAYDLDWPTSPDFEIKSPWGPRDNPNNPGQNENHPGIDLGDERGPNYSEGTPVTSPGDGTVTSVETPTTNPNTGNGVRVDLGQKRCGNIQIRGVHLQKVTVEKGKKVKKGETIGYIGNTGKSKAAHLHLEVKVNNILIDPRAVFPYDKFKKR
jgi:RHS repeat-associated protein